MLIFNPILAKKIGLNQAIFLTQLQYWINKCGIEKDGDKWVYRTYEEWSEQFPFWSMSTLKRTIKSLEQIGAIKSGEYNRASFDRTKWYSINWLSPLIQNDTVSEGVSMNQTIQ